MCGSFQRSRFSCVLGVIVRVADVAVDSCLAKSPRVTWVAYWGLSVWRVARPTARSSRCVHRINSRVRLVVSKKGLTSGSGQILIRNLARAGTRWFRLLVGLRVNSCLHHYSRDRHSFCRCRCTFSRQLRPGREAKASSRTGLGTPMRVLVVHHAFGYLFEEMGEALGSRHRACTLLRPMPDEHVRLRRLELMAFLAEAVCRQWSASGSPRCQHGRGRERHRFAARGRSSWLVVCRTKILRWVEARTHSPCLTRCHSYTTCSFH